MIKRRYKIYTTLSLRKTRNYLHNIDMAKIKKVLQTMGFAFGESEVSFAPKCVFTTLPLRGEAVESMGRVTDYLVEQMG